MGTIFGGNNLMTAQADYLRNLNCSEASADFVLFSANFGLLCMETSSPPASLRNTAPGQLRNLSLDHLPRSNL